MDAARLVLRLMAGASDYPQHLKDDIDTLVSKWLGISRRAAKRLREQAERELDEEMRRG